MARVKLLGHPERRIKIVVQVELLVTTTSQGRNIPEMLALEASSHNEFDPDETSILTRKYGTAEVVNQSIMLLEEEEPKP